MQYVQTKINEHRAREEKQNGTNSETRNHKKCYCSVIEKTDERTAVKVQIRIE